jgi:hypothetical protein
MAEEASATCPLSSTDSFVVPRQRECIASYAGDVHRRFHPRWPEVRHEQSIGGAIGELAKWFQIDSARDKIIPWP